MRNPLGTFLIAAGLLLGVFGITVPESAANAQEKKDAAKSKDEKAKPKSGTVIGELTEKSDNWIEVKADGEDKARRYVPEWKGGAPKDGGGLDKEMLKKIKSVTKGSRVRVEWKFEERLRVVKLEVLKEPIKQDK